MEKKLYFIEPVFEAKYWGGQALKERYGYTPDSVSYTHLAVSESRKEAYVSSAA